MNLRSIQALAPAIVAALISGAALMLVSPPIGLGWLHWFSFLPLFWALRSGEVKRNAKLGYLAGWVAVFLLFFWLIETVVRFSNLPWVLALAIHILFASAFALPYAAVFGAVHWFRDRIGAAWVFVLPALLVSVEKLSPALFPYYQGAGQFRSPAIWQLTSVTGVMGVSYLVFLVNCLLAEGVYRRREGRAQSPALIAGVAALWFGNLGFGAWRHQKLEAEIAAAPTFQAAIVQQGVTMEERMASSVLAGLRSWLDGTKEALVLKPDLLVWAEGAIFFNPNDEQPVNALGKLSPREFFERLSRTNDVDFLIGGGTIHREETSPYKVTEAYNSVYLFTRKGELKDRYDKMVPLPFGEYIPLSDTFPFLRDLIEGPGDFHAGTRPTVFDGTTRDGGVSFTYSVPICYEAILEAQMWEMFRGEREQPVDLFVNITNDGWFGDTTAPHQHAMLAAVQATTFGRPVLRLAYTGVSFVVDPHGDIHDETEPFTDVAAVATVRLGKADTLYVRGGWVFPWLCLLATAAAGFVARRRS